MEKLKEKTFTTGTENTQSENENDKVFNPLKQQG